MSDFVVIYVTVSSEAEGTKIARALVEERLAACVNVVPNVQSFYRWEGNIRNDRELLLIIKSQGLHISDLIGRIKELHSYRVPEVISLPIVTGNSDYLAWIKKETDGVVPDKDEDRPPELQG